MKYLSILITGALLFISPAVIADTVDVCIVGYYKKGESVFIKDKYNKTIFSGNCSYTGNYRWDFKLLVSDSIPEYDNIPIRFYYCKTHKSPKQINLLFLKQDDRKALLIERFALYNNKFSFRVIWFDYLREDILLPEYRRSIFTNFFYHAPPQLHLRPQPRASRLRRPAGSAANLRLRPHRPRTLPRPARSQPPLQPH